MKESIRKIQLHNIEKYQVPCFITMTGQSGAGKTLLAQQLSRELKIFLLSNDYVRTYYLQCQKMKNRRQIEREVLKINSERLMKLMINRASFVLDRDFNHQRELILSSKLAKICGYIPIHIKINSCDEDNIRRIQSRKVNYQQKDFTIIGDNTAYSSPFSEEQYFEITKTKPRMIEDFPFDYVLNNEGTEEQFVEKASQIAKEIKQEKLVRQKVR